MTTTPQTEPISDFMERHFAHLRHGRKEYTEAEVRSIMLAFEAGLSHLVAENSDLRERNAAMWHAQEIALDTATEHELKADELRGALATAEAERDQLRAQLSKAVAEEREACAKVCDDRYMGDNNREDMEAKRCAAAIRARSNT